MTYSLIDHHQKETFMTNAALKKGHILAGDNVAVAFAVTAPAGISIKAGARFEIGGHSVVYDVETPIQFISGLASPGSDFVVFAYSNGAATAFPSGTEPQIDGGSVIGGFHYAPGGNALGTDGGDAEPAINPYSCWDIKFRPACDPSGMMYVSNSPGAPHVVPFWRDIYFLNTDPAKHGTSIFGAEIATGAAPPVGYRNLNYFTSIEVLAKFGKKLMSLDQFAASAYGVTERSAAGTRVKTTAVDPKRTSRFGGMQDTGNLWCWGHDGHVDVPAAAFFGGSWGDAADSGSRASVWINLPSFSNASLGARGCCDHLFPVQPAR